MIESPHFDTNQKYSDIPAREDLNDFSVQTLSLSEHDDRIAAAKAVRAGTLLGLENYRVFAIVGDGENPDAFDSLCSIKGESRRGRQVALALPSDEIVKIVDIDLIPDILKPVFENPSLLSQLTGSMFFWRFPIRSEIAERWKDYPWLFSHAEEYGNVPYVQCWDSVGGGHTRSLIEDIRSMGTEFPLITSMNVSGSPEITEWNKASYFCEKRGVKYLLKAPDARVTAVGSYTTFTVRPELGEPSDYDLELTRDGNVPGYLIETILKQSLNPDIRIKRDMGSVTLEDNGKFVFSPGRTRFIVGQRNFPSNLVDGLPPSVAYAAINAWSEDASPEKLAEIISKQN